MIHRDKINVVGDGDAARDGDLPKVPHVFGSAFSSHEAKPLFILI